MQKELAVKLVELMNDSGEEARLYEDYSGRGMFGEMTTGVVCSSINKLLMVVIANASEFVDGDGYEIFPYQSLKTDNLGLRTIVY